MSGRLESINKRKLHGKKARTHNLAAWKDANKKAKLLIAEPPPAFGCITCGQTPRADHLSICGQCGCKNAIIDTSKLDLSGHVAVNQVPFGKDSLKNSDYQEVLSMLPEELIHDFCSYFVRECSKGNDSITQEELQQHLNLLDTKQIFTISFLNSLGDYISTNSEEAKAGILSKVNHI
jgi:Zn finger protein HypA/HybF involved in hydrogenase expression